MALADNRFCRGGERVGHPDIRWAERLLHEKRQPAVEELGAIQLPSHSIHVCQARERTHDAEVFRAEGAFKKWQGLLVESLGLVVRTLIGGPLRLNRELEPTLEVLELG